MTTITQLAHVAVDLPSPSSFFSSFSHVKCELEITLCLARRLLYSVLLFLVSGCGSWSVSILHCVRSTALMLQSQAGRQVLSFSNPTSSQ